MDILAIDLGKFNSMACFYDMESGEYRYQAVKTRREYLTTLVSKHAIDLVVMEACSCSGWVNDLCGELRLPTLVCRTLEEVWRWRNVKRKNDKDDALKLARLAAVKDFLSKDDQHLPNHGLHSRCKLTERTIKIELPIVSGTNHNTQFRFGPTPCYPTF